MAKTSNRRIEKRLINQRDVDARKVRGNALSFPYGGAVNPRETMSQAERHAATSGPAATDRHLLANGLLKMKIEFHR
jgi:hypothetical protein